MKTIWSGLIGIILNTDNNRILITYLDASHVNIIIGHYNLVIMEMEYFVHDAVFLLQYIFLF